MRFAEFEGDWEEKKLKELGSFFSGGTPKTTNKDFYDGHISFIRSGEIASEISELRISEEGLKNSSAKMVDKGEILIALYGANSGDIALSKMYGAINQAVLCFDTKQNKQFFKNLWENHSEKILETFLQGGQGNLSAEIVKNLKFNFPKIDEQNRIASFFELIEDKIETQRKTLKQLSILKSASIKKIFSEIQSFENQTFSIKDILNYEQPTKYIVSNTDYVSDKSQIPVLTANKAFVLGYTTENFGIYNKGNCIILDDFTMDSKFVDFDFKVKSSAIKILTAKENMNLKFIYEYFSYLNFSSSEHKRHYISEIEPMELILPDIEKQKQFANFFISIDDKIKNEERLLDLYETQKKYLLKNLFI